MTRKTPMPHHYRDEIPLLPGANGFLGHAQAIRNDRFTLFETIANTQRDMNLLKLGSEYVITLSGPEALREVLVHKWKSFTKSASIRVLLYPLIGNGVVTSDADVWHRSRKLMAPLFQPSYLTANADGIVQCIRQWIDGLKEGDEIDVVDEATRLTMNVVSKALFDLDTTSHAAELIGALGVVLEEVSRQAISTGLLFKSAGVDALEKLEGRLPGFLERARAGTLNTLRQPFPLPTRSSRQYREALATVHSLVDHMIAERRKSGLHRHDFLTRLLTARDEDDGATMSDKQVRDEILTLFFTGHETTAVAMTWALVSLSQRADILARVKQEVAILEGRAPSVEDLSKLPYSLRVLKEAMRLYPSVPMFDRIAKEDVEIGGHSLPRGTMLFVLPYALHRRPDIYANPHEFDPDRFLPDAEESRHRLAYLPFGAGPRICIGVHFALMEAQFALAMIMQRLTLTALPSDITPSNLAFFRPVEPFKMKIERKLEEGACA
ncbi:MAG TPA: cytochrome P450 [Polyangium sp.]|nr:cytochrome P450 [Polyangium sp.]